MKDIYKKSIEEFLCNKIIDRCDVKYPRFPFWYLCGYSFIVISGEIICKNNDLIKNILGLDKQQTMQTYQ